MERPLRALRMGRIATRSKIGALLMTRMSAIAQLGAVPPLRERLQSALCIDGTTHASISSHVSNAVEPEVLLDRYRLEHVICVQFQRAAP
jgi:hypothetical protein